MWTFSCVHDYSGYSAKKCNQSRFYFNFFFYVYDYLPTCLVSKKAERELWTSGTRGTDIWKLPNGVGCEQKLSPLKK